MCISKVEKLRLYEAASVMVCPDCVEEKLQVDPRTRNADYPVIITRCSIHRLIYNPQKIQEETK